MVNQMRSLYYTVIVIILCCLLLEEAYCLETRRGVIKRNTEPVCAIDCDKFYLDPDPSYWKINLYGYDFYTYVGLHVEVLGSRGSCSGCTVMHVISITVLPPLGVEQDNMQLPRELTLHQNFPNPFNPQTSIQYTLPSSQHVVLTIHNVMGQSVAMLVDKVQPSGSYTMTWDAQDKPSGVYYYRLRTGVGIIVKKMLLLR